VRQAFVVAAQFGQFAAQGVVLRPDFDQIAAQALQFFVEALGEFSLLLLLGLGGLLGRHPVGLDALAQIDDRTSGLVVAAKQLRLRRQGRSQQRQQQTPCAQPGASKGGTCRHVSDKPVRRGGSGCARLRRCRRWPVFLRQS